MDLTTHMPLVSPERRFISALHRLESMSTRRDFLNLTVKGSAMAAAAALLPPGLSAQVNTGDGSSRSTRNSGRGRSGVFPMRLQFALKELDAIPQFKGAKLGSE
jgi:hypothetical protein